MIKMLNMDCMEYMRTVPDKYFDLAIIDPPYGIGESSKKREFNTERWSVKKQKVHNVKKWDDCAPDEE